MKKLLDWGSLIADALSRGVKIRLLLNDFDPAAVPDLHASVWERVALLDYVLSENLPQALDGLEVMVAHPGGQSGAILRTVVWPSVRKLLNRTREEFIQTGRNLPPGYNKFQSGVPIWPPVRNFTQSLHQKFILADNQRAILGGLDIDERRYDDPSHKRTGEETWHDVSVSLEGDAAYQLGGHFEEMWTLVKRFGHSYAQVYKAQDPRSVLNFVEPAGEAGPRRVAYGSTNLAPIVRTIGHPTRSFLSFGPAHFESSFEHAYLRQIDKAREMIYVETQFFRSKAIRNALLSALGKNPVLQVIMLLPGAPDAVAYEGKRGGVHRYSEWLQMRSIDRLSRLFPDRFAAFALTSEVNRDEQSERDSLFGKSMVYIHSKLMIADDQVAIIGSANLNGRSMEWDIEAGILIDDQSFAKNLRKQLWHMHLGEEAVAMANDDDYKSFLNSWKKLSLERAAQGVTAKGNGVVPYPMKRTKRFSKRHFFIPEQMV
ncbi:MAG: phospholipase D-like domain-containing protein [Pseudomonadota bacterium]